MKKHWIFPENIAEAKRAQNEMIENVIIEDQLSTIQIIAGMDVSNTRFDPKKMVYGSVVALSYPSFEVLEISSVAAKQKFPYIPGYLGFREAPVLVEAFQKLTIKPDLIMVDGHGISHPRGLGVATHLGVLLDIPTIGIAKSILYGEPGGILSKEAGSMVPLIANGKHLGMMMRSKKNCLPLIVSAGHKITLTSAISIVQKCLTRYRLPETTRHAHLAANHCRRSFSCQ